jgi:nicotinate-nucleotide adenylyltransferase
MKKTIGILGGTFDPIHFGHLRIALELHQQLRWQEVRFIPCRKPVLHKTTQASAQQRLTMLRKAIKNQPGFVIDDRELRRDTPSYTIDTLISLREELGDVALCLILGSDSVNNLPSWHRWQELIRLAHLVIVPRPGHPLLTSGPVAKLIQQYRTVTPNQLQHNAAGRILITPLTPLPISATEIRRQITKGLSPRYLLPDAVYTYIQQQNLYKTTFK